MLNIERHPDQLDRDLLREAMIHLSVVLLILMFGRNHYTASSGYLAFEMLLGSDSTRSKLW